MPWNISRADVDFFRRELWKDLRLFPWLADGEYFAKDCFTDSLAQLEARVVSDLYSLPGEKLVPAVRSVSGTTLVLERLRGIRLYDLIRCLRQIESNAQDGRAVGILLGLIDRCAERLGRIQDYLYEVRHSISVEPYPLDEKLYDLLTLFIKVLDIKRTPTGWQESLVQLGERWRAEYSIIPFRDATSKNILIVEPKLSSDVVTDEERLDLLAKEFLVKESEYWQSVRIADVDFSSVIHSTSLEDDPISLFSHEWTKGLHAISPGSLLLTHTTGVAPSAERSAASFVVRYLRFGGRKLAYRLINSQGYKVRFAYDDPLFYFRELASVCKELCPEFFIEHRPLLELVEMIGEAASCPTAADRALLSIDHLRRFYPSAHYWQENPNELADSPG